MVFNQVQNILKSHGFATAKPNKEQLQKMGMTIHRFNKILKNHGAELSYSEAVHLCKWFRHINLVKQPYELFESVNI